MKYVLMFVSQPELDAAIPAERQEQDYQQIYAWFEENGKAFADGGAELQPATTATSIRAADEPGGAPIVVDGPFSEAKESIGGFAIIDVPDLDAAIALVRTWPSLEFSGTVVEIRPIVDHSGD
ncbi:MAG: YciI family protein [Candidatus Limnocylindria bacterium]